MRKLQEDIKLILDYCNVERAMNFEERKAYNRLLDFTQLHSIYQGIPVEDRLNEQEETIQSLKKELFESEKDYIMETYSDNPIRRDEKIQSLKEEFKARFGDVE